MTSALDLAPEPRLTDMGLSSLVYKSGSSSPKHLEPYLISPTILQVFVQVEVLWRVLVKDNRLRNTSQRAAMQEEYDFVTLNPQTLNPKP